MTVSTFSSVHQLYTGVSLLCAGFLSAVLYDMLLPACRICSRGLQLLMDLFLCTATALLILLSLYGTGSAVLRAYMLFAFAGGAVLYRCSIRRAIRFLTKQRLKKRKKHADGE